MSMARYRSVTICSNCCQRNIYFSATFRYDGGVAAASDQIARDCNLRVDVCVQIGEIAASE